jgi:hypothetical protein
VLSAERFRMRPAKVSALQLSKNGNRFPFATANFREFLFYALG